MLDNCQNNFSLFIYLYAGYPQSPRGTRRGGGQREQIIKRHDPCKRLVFSIFTNLFICASQFRRHLIPTENTTDLVMKFHRVGHSFFRHSFHISEQSEYALFYFYTDRYFSSTFALLLPSTFLMQSINLTPQIYGITRISIEYVLYACSFLNVKHSFLYLIRSN